MLDLILRLNAKSFQLINKKCIVCMDTSDENLATRHLKLGILFVVRAKNLFFKKE